MSERGAAACEASRRGGRPRPLGTVTRPTATNLAIEALSPPRVRPHLLVPAPQPRERRRCFSAGQLGRGEETLQAVSPLAAPGPSSSPHRAAEAEAVAPVVGLPLRALGQRLASSLQPRRALWAVPRQLLRPQTDSPGPRSLCPRVPRRPRQQRLQRRLRALPLAKRLPQPHDSAHRAGVDTGVACTLCSLRQRGSGPRRGHRPCAPGPHRALSRARRRPRRSIAPQWILLRAAGQGVQRGGVGRGPRGGARRVCGQVRGHCGMGGQPCGRKTCVRRHCSGLWTAAAPRRGAEACVRLGRVPRLLRRQGGTAAQHSISGTASCGPGRHGGRLRRVRRQLDEHLRGWTCRVHHRIPRPILHWQCQTRCVRGGRTAQGRGQRWRGRHVRQKLRRLSTVATAAHARIKRCMHCIGRGGNEPLGGRFILLHLRSEREGGLDLRPHARLTQPASATTAALLGISDLEHRFTCRQRRGGSHAGGNLGFWPRLLARRLRPRQRLYRRRAAVGERGLDQLYSVHQPADSLDRLGAPQRVRGPKHGVLEPTGVTLLLPQVNQRLVSDWVRRLQGDCLLVGGDGLVHLQTAPSGEHTPWCQRGEAVARVSGAYVAKAELAQASHHHKAVSRPVFANSLRRRSSPAHAGCASWELCDGPPSPSPARPPRLRCSLIAWPPRRRRRRPYQPSLVAEVGQSAQP